MTLRTLCHKFSVNNASPTVAPARRIQARSDVSGTTGAISLSLLMRTLVYPCVSLSRCVRFCGHALPFRSVTPSSRVAAATRGKRCFSLRLMPPCRRAMCCIGAFHVKKPPFLFLPRANHIVCSIRGVILIGPRFAVSLVVVRGLFVPREVERTVCD